MRPIGAVILATLLHAGCTAAVAEPLSSATPGQTPSPTAATVRSDSPSAAEPTPIPNLQAGVMSENGLFRASWESRPEEVPPLNVVHEWVLHIETAAGEPAVGALVTIDGDMPAHGHGMPTEPEVTEDLGDGDYLVEGMSFQMGGYWIIDVSVTYGDETDHVRFGLDL